MIFKEITHNSDEYKKSLGLRENILRKPLGLKLSKKDTFEENKQLHFGVFNEPKIIACVIIKPIGKGLAKLRQMAVLSTCQKQGVGKFLIESVEVFLKKQKYTYIEMSARESAIDFYKKLGYSTTGRKFKEINLQHIKMRKDL